MLNGLFANLGRLLPKKKQRDPLDVASEEAAAGLGQARADRADALGRLAAPPPKPADASVDPLDAIVGLFAGLGAGAGSQAGQRAFNAPVMLARDRAETTDRANLQAFQQSQELARGQVASADRLIGGYMDRQSIIDKLRADRESKTAERTLRERLAMVKEGSVLAQSLARMGDNLTPVGVKAILAQMPQNQDLDDAGLSALATTIYQEAIANPSFKGQIDRERLAVQRQEGEDKRRADLEKIAGDDVNQTPLARYNAAMLLSRVPGSMFEGMTPADIRAHIETQQSLKAMDIQADNTRADRSVDLREQQLKQVASQWERNFTRLQKKDANDLRLGLARVAIARKNAETSAGNLSLAQRKASPEYIELVGSIENGRKTILGPNGVVKKLQRDIANQQGIVKATTDEEKLAAAEAKLLGLQQELSEVFGQAYDAGLITDEEAGKIIGRGFIGGNASPLQVNPSPAIRGAITPKQPSKPKPKPKPSPAKQTLKTSTGATVTVTKIQ